MGVRFRRLEHAWGGDAGYQGRVVGATAASLRNLSRIPCPRAYVRAYYMYLGKEQRSIGPLRGIAPETLAQHTCSRMGCCF